MRSPLLRGLAPFIPFLVLVGCASLPEGEGAAAREETTSSSEGRTAAISAESSSAGRDTERRAAGDSIRRDDREPAPVSRDSRPGAEAGRSELVAQLNEASRELAVLRAANAKLKAERSTPPSTTSSSSSSARAEPVDDKLNATLRSYTQFRQELTAFVAEIDKLRAENASLHSQLKEVAAKSQGATGSLARLERELKAEREARAEADRMVASLRDQLRAVARALSSAGVTVDPGASERGTRTGTR